MGLQELDTTEGLNNSKLHRSIKICQAAHFRTMSFIAWRERKKKREWGEEEEKDGRKVKEEGGRRGEKKEGKTGKGRKQVNSNINFSVKPPYDLDQR